jgi:predicted transcriptional regulator
MSSDNSPRPARPESPGLPPGSAATPGDDHPRLQLRDPKAMRALAHPLRVALIEALGQADAGTLTATEASELLGESPTNCAFHLRTLAKYGFVEEAGGGRGRERPWRLRYRGIEVVPPWQDQESRLALEAAASVWIDRWLARARERLMRVVGYPAEWQEAAIASQTGVFLTAREAKDLGHALSRLLEPYLARWHDPSQRPAGSCRYEVLAFGYPLTDPPETAGLPGPANPPEPPTTRS